MGNKEDFIATLNNDLPDGILDTVETPISFEGISFPDSVDAAQIEQGKLAARLNKIFDDLQGLPLVDLILHVGQRNITQQLMMLSGLSYIKEGETDDNKNFKVITPTKGGSYTEGTLIFRAKRLSNDFSSMGVKVDGKDGQSMPETDGVFMYTAGPFDPGDHTAIFYDDTTLEGFGVTIPFVITDFEWGVSPADGATLNYQAVNLRVTVPKTVESVSVDVDGKSFDLSSSIAGIFEGVMDLSKNSFGAVSATVKAVESTTGKVFIKSLSYIYGE